MPFSLSDFNYLSRQEIDSMQKEKLLTALKYIIAYKTYKINLMPEDVLNLLIDCECVSKDEVMVLLAHCEKTLIKPVVPPNHLG